MKTIKGTPCDKWAEVQSVQHSPFVYIASNGSRWMGEEVGDIDELLYALENKGALDVRMFGSFINDNPCEGVFDANTRKYVDGPRMFDVPVTYFFGNFEEYSHVFSIYTNNAETIELLTSAINRNLERIAA